MKRTLMAWEHDAFRASFDQFLDRVVVPRWDEFESAGIVARSVWKAAGDAGFLAPEIPDEYGGIGSDDFRYNAVITSCPSNCPSTARHCPSQKDTRWTTHHI